MPSPASIVETLDATARRTLTPGGAGAMVWRAWGAGPPVVLFHGGSGSWTHWLRNIPALAARFRVIAPDMPGFGDSALPPAPHTADALADIVSAGLDAMVPPPEPLDLAGFSLGGIIGGLVAARQGARIRTLVLLGPNGMKLPRAPLPALHRVRPDMPAAQVMETHRQNLLLLMLAKSASADALAVYIHSENLRRARFRSGHIPDSDALLRALPAVRARLAAIWGGQDVFALPHLDARKRTLAAFQANLDFRVIEGAGHWVTYEAADEVNRSLVEILG